MSSLPNNPGPHAQPIELQELPEAGDRGPALFNHQLDLIQSVKLRLGVSVGSAEVSVAELFALKEGGLLALDKATDEPVDIYLDDKLVGRGELVVVDDHFGVRITQLGRNGAP